MPPPPGEPMTGARPLFPDLGLVSLTPEAWGDIWQVRHAVMSRLARYFHVVWMDPPRHWRYWWGSRPDEAALDGPAANGSFQVYRSGRWLPRFYNRVPGRVFDLLRTRRAAALARRAGARCVGLYIWRPDFAWATRALPGAVTCYHIDDETSFSTVEQPLREDELALMHRADVTFIHSPGLWERKAPLARHPVQAPNGVDFSAYMAPVPEPADLRAIPHPRIGYVGVIRRFLDLPLMLTLAQRHPAWSFVFVGPARALGSDGPVYEALRALPNVHLLGQRPPAALPAYTRYCDVGIMPYDVDDYTKYIYPLKLHEYLAAGLPTVGTDIRTLREFRDVVCIATGVDEWSAALQSALEDQARTPDAVAARRRVARAHDWDVLVHHLAMELARRFGIADPEGIAGPPPSGDLPAAE